MPTQMIIRMPDDLKSKVSSLAKAEGKNVSAIVRELLENYVKDRDIGSHIDDLWGRIGAKLQDKGVKPADISRAIRETRSKQ